jgi:signal transduction histidine kinase/ActR/RegA family two-component response regulator
LGSEGARLRGSQPQSPFADDPSAVCLGKGEGPVETSTTWQARLAGFGLGAVLLLLAMSAVAGTLVTDRAVTRANKLTALSSAYERARFAVGEEESLERKYRLEASPQIRVRYRAAVADVVAAMREVARTGNERDAEVAHKVLAEHRPYLAGIGRMFDAIDRHDTRTAVRIDASEVDPAFGKIETWVRDAAAQDRRVSADALRDSASVSRLVVWLAPVVFAVGLVLLAFLWRVRRREQRTASIDLARQNELLSDQAARLRRMLEERELAESELAETQERLRNAQRLESIGQLAGGVAHDFNNLLQIILGYCGLLETNLPEDSRHKVAAIATAAGRGADLTRQLLAFGRRQTLKPAVWDVNAIVANVESMLGRILPGAIDFKALPSETELRARVDRGQLEQVLVNLVLNARDSMPDGGSLTIFTEPLELDRPVAVEELELPPGSYIRIAVSDTGCGMDAETAARAFEPFFTTKELGHGAGLGLATVYGIVRQSGGFVSIDSTAGVGTEIAVCLPRTLEPAAHSPVPEAAAPAQIHPVEQVLLVEDETDVRTVLASYLRGRGYDVLEAANGLEGLEVFREHRSHISVVVTDIVMPQLDGWGLVNELRRVSESLPIVVMSGFAGETQRADDERLEHLTKPFAPVEVTRAITRLVPDGARPH